MLLSGLDLNRAVKGGRVSNSLLEFKQCSLTHIAQVLGFHSGTRFLSSPLFRHAMVLLRVSPASKSDDLVGNSSSTYGMFHTILHAAVRRTSRTPMSATQRDSARPLSGL